MAKERTIQVYGVRKEERRKLKGSHTPDPVCLGHGAHGRLETDGPGWANAAHVHRARGSSGSRRNPAESIPVCPGFGAAGDLRCLGKPMDQIHKATGSSGSRRNPKVSIPVCRGFDADGDLRCMGKPMAQIHRARGSFQKSAESESAHSGLSGAWRGRRFETEWQTHGSVPQGVTEGQEATSSGFVRSG